MNGVDVPQPGPSRITDFAGHPLVVAIAPNHPAHLVLTAVSLARAVGAQTLYVAHVDPQRYTLEEFPDGTVRHADIRPDVADDTWKDRARALEDEVGRTLEGSGQDWTFRYLAGRPDRALTHLARAVDAAAIVIGSRRGGAGARAREFLDGSIAANLVHHQHRPVLVVPTRVVDWKDQVWTR